MKLSFAITVKDELIELSRLLDILINYNFDKIETEIVILYDVVNGSKKISEYLRAGSVVKSYYRHYPFEFDGDFAKLKNQFYLLCTGDFIFQLDADEFPNETLLKHLPYLLHEPDLIFLPRWNTVSGITSEDIKNWEWKLDDQYRINWPDYQGRIYRRDPTIMWKGKVHETIQGHKSYAVIEPEADMHLIHEKTIEKQRLQNKFYNTL
jgi:hypothetical protein